MACDGIWDCVDEQRLCEEISRRLKKKEKISNIISDLMDNILAKENNSIFTFLKLAPIGTDNMSCIVIQFKHEEKEECYYNYKN